MNNTLTLNNPLSESDWDKISDVELEKTEHIWFKTPSGKRVDFIKSDVLDKIKAEIEQEYNCLSVTRADETLELGECLGLKMALKIIDKYRESGGVNKCIT